MTSKQLAIDFPPSTNISREDFALGPCNAQAADWIDRWPDWPPGGFKGLVLEGAEASGKSHLGAIWTSDSGAIIMDRLAEDSLRQLDEVKHVIWDKPIPSATWADDLVFHMLNRLLELEGSLLILSRVPMSELNWSLSDVSSRLNAMLNIRILPPCDSVLIAVMQKKADDFGVVLNSESCQYLLSRIERDFASAIGIVERLNYFSLSEKRKMTVPFLRHALNEMNIEEK